MKTLNMRINFTWDNEDDLWEFKLTVPEDVNSETVQDIIIKEHNFLCEEDETDIYGINGRCPVVLMDYICKKYQWKWEDLDYDIDINLA